MSQKYFYLLFLNAGELAEIRDGNELSCLFTGGAANFLHERSGGAFTADGDVFYILRIDDYATRYGFMRNRHL